MIRGIVKERHRGPHKEDGGRPKVLLFDDPDRWIIAIAFWLRRDPKDQRSIAPIQALDNLLTPHEGVDLVLETCSIKGVEHGVLGIINTTPDRASDRRLNRNVLDRLPRSAPGGKRFRKSRVQYLQAKIAAFQRTKLTEKEAQWLGTCLLGLNFIVAPGTAEMGFLALASAGLQLPDAGCQRIADLLQKMR